jgi:hypothetical protein
MRHRPPKQHPWLEPNHGTGVVDVNPGTVAKLVKQPQEGRLVVCKHSRKDGIQQEHATKRLCSMTMTMADSDEKHAYAGG